MDEIEAQERDEENDFLHVLVETELISASAKGIIKQALDQGIDSLSQKQTQVYEDVLTRYRTYECLRGGHYIPLNEVIDALYYKDDKLCSYCRNSEKSDD